MQTILLTLLVASVLAVIPATVENCGIDNIILFNAATLSSSPKKGDDVTIVLYGTSNDHVELKNVLMKALWNGAEVFQQDNANDNIYDTGDPVTYEVTTNFPSYMPAGRTVLQFQFKDIQRMQVGCAQIRFTL